MVRRKLEAAALILVAFAAAACVMVPGADGVSQHYVDGGRRSAGDGQSWETAWRSFAEIDWTAIEPGDVLSISGGTAGRVYRETLVIGASGSAGRPITIRAAVDPGHAGESVIDAENRRANGIVLDGRDHVRVRGFAVRNVDDAAVRIRDASAGVLVEGVRVTAGNPLGHGNARGFDVRDSSGVELRGNSFTTPTRSPAQNDGIFSMGNAGVRYVGNRFVMRNGYQGPNEGHNDCIQSYLDRDIRIVGNYCEQRNTKIGHSLGILVQNISGTALVTDNVVLSPNTRSGCIAVENLPDFPARGRMLAYHNTAYGCAYGTLHIVRSPLSEAYNNILVSPSPGAQAVKVVAPAPPPANIDHNLLFTPNSSAPIFLDGVGVKTWSEWRGLGYEPHGVFGDPHFRDPATGDLRLEAASIACGRARSLVAAQDDSVARTWLANGKADLGAFARHQPPWNDAAGFPSRAGRSPGQASAPSKMSERDNS